MTPPPPLAPLALILHQESHETEVSSKEMVGSCRGPR